MKKMRKIWFGILTGTLLLSILVSGRMIQSASAEETLLAYWKFDDPDDYIASDSSGNGKDITLASEPNKPAWVSGYSGGTDDYALEFDGVDDYGTYPALYTTGPTSIKFQALIYPHDVMGTLAWGGERIILHHGSPGEFTSSTHYGNVHFGVKLTTGGWHGMGAKATINAWHNLTGVWTKGGYVWLYLDGDLVAAQPVPDCGLVAAGPTTIGSYGGSRSFFDGIIDEVKVYTNVSPPPLPPSFYTLTTSTSSPLPGEGGASTMPLPGTYHYAPGIQTYVLAAQDTGGEYVLDHWELNGTNIGSENPCLLTMDANYALRAVFAKPLAFWKFDEGSGDIAYDSSGKGKHITLASPPKKPAWVTGYSGYALEFDGVDDYGTYPTLYTTSPTSIKVQALIYPHDVNATIAHHGSHKIIWHGNTGAFDQQVIGGNVFFNVRLSDGRWHTIGAKTTINTWHNVTGIWTKGGYMWLYLDGVLVGATEVGDYNLIASGTIPTIGAYENGVESLFDGIIDEVKVYSGASPPPAPPPNFKNLTISSSTYEYQDFGACPYPFPGNYTYLSGTQVNIVALEDTGGQYVLDHWELNGTNIGSENPYLLTMDANYALRAVYATALPTHDVAMDSLKASPTSLEQGQTARIAAVVKNEGTFLESFSVTAYYDDTAIGSQTVTNLPPRNAKWVWFDWNTGGVSPGTYTIKAVASTVSGETDTTDNTKIDGMVTINPYNVTIDAYCYTEVTAVSVAITMDGTPTGYTTPHTFTGLSGTHTFTVPDTDPNGHQFKQWNTGETNTTITVSSGGTYTAYYQAKYTLTITTTTGGTTNPTPGTYTYWDGITVNVEALPSLGYLLDYWELEGANVGAPNPISVTMNTSHTLHAVFSWVGTYNLTITTTTGGTTSPTFGTYSYTNGTEATVTAIPDTGCALDHWELDEANAGSQNPIIVTMDSNHTLHAVFTNLPPVGGIWVPVDKLGLLAPYIGLASTIIVATVIYVKRVKPRKEKR